MLNPLQTIKKLILQNGSALRLSVTIEGIYFIFLESTVIKDTNFNYSLLRTNKEMLWNSEGLWSSRDGENWELSSYDYRHIADIEYDNFKNNPLIGG